MKSQEPGSTVYALTGVLALVAAGLPACAGVVQSEDKGAGGQASPGAQGSPNMNNPPGTPAPGGGAASMPPPGPALAAPVLNDPTSFGPTGVRRLTRGEVRRVLGDVFGQEFGAEVDTFLPIDERTPFDNGYATQSPSTALIEGLKALAEKVSEAALAPASRAKVIGCAPRSSDDRACLRELAAKLGRRLLRRPLAVAELDELTALGALGAQANDFYFAAGAVLRALLQDMEFIYRLEIGDTVPGRGARLIRLTPYELASRLSFFIWGTAPDDALLDSAATGRLNDAVQLRDIVNKMAWHKRSLEQIQRMHAMWLAYDNLVLPPQMVKSLTTETNALVQRVLEERRPWTDLFTFAETFVDPVLAQHYGLPKQTAAAWVKYPADGRRLGLLSHGSFLNFASDAHDTDPVLRGKNVLTRLLCREIPPPPPGVDPSMPPGSNPAGCKPARMPMRKAANCAACHSMMDNIGFGLENHGPTGEWRATEPGRADCPIDGAGQLPGVGTFKAAAGLGRLLVENGELAGCFAEHLYQFTLGRPEGPSDAATVKAVASAFSVTPDLLALIAAIAQSEAFRNRVVEGAP